MPSLIDLVQGLKEHAPLGALLSVRILEDPPVLCNHVEHAGSDLFGSALKAALVEALGHLLVNLPSALGLGGLALEQILTP